MPRQTKEKGRRTSVVIRPYPPRNVQETANPRSIIYDEEAATAKYTSVTDHASIPLYHTNPGTNSATHFNRQEAPASWPYENNDQHGQRHEQSYVLPARSPATLGHPPFNVPRYPFQPSPSHSVAPFLHDQQNPHLYTHNGTSLYAHPGYQSHLAAQTDHLTTAQQQGYLPLPVQQ